MPRRVATPSVTPVSFTWVAQMRQTYEGQAVVRNGTEFMALDAPFDGQVLFNSGSGTIYVGDNRRVMAEWPDNCVDAVVTDPPYELGFMGRKWDSSGIAYDVAMWGQVLRVLKPGGHLLSFGGDRTHHRMFCAIEDAGFEIRTSLAWIFGSGFPKSLNVNKKLGDALCACVQRSTQTTPDSQDDCLPADHSCDELPLKAKETGERVSPSQGDAHGHSRGGRRVDGIGREQDL